MAKKSANALDSWQARAEDLQTGAAVKRPRAAHIKYGEAAGDTPAVPVTQKMQVPAGLAVLDLPFDFTRGGLQSADARAASMADWRPADAAARDALAAAIKEAAAADAYARGQAARVADALAARGLTYTRAGYDDHIVTWYARQQNAQVIAWVTFSEVAKTAARGRAADAAVQVARQNIRYLAGKKTRDDRRAQKTGAGADAWSLVDPEAVRAWLDGAAWRQTGGPLVLSASPYNAAYMPRLSDAARLRGVPPVPEMRPASPYNAAYMPRLSFAQRSRLMRARADVRARAQLVLMQEAARLGCAVDALPRINHYIAVLPPAWSKLAGGAARTDTAQVMIAAQCRRWGVAALAGPIRRSGAPYLLALRAQNADIMRREAAAEQTYNALIGGPVRGAVAGDATGTGGMRYKISVTDTRAAGGAKVCYRWRKWRKGGHYNDRVGLYLPIKEAAEESSAAMNAAVLGVRLTELDAIINSCACPSIPAGAKNEVARVNKSLLSVLDRDCYSLDDIGRGYYYKRAAAGADAEMRAERGEAARAAAARVDLVSLDAADDTGAARVDAIGATGVECVGVLMETLRAIARAAAPARDADAYDRLLVMRAQGFTLEEAAQVLGRDKSTLSRWQHKIISAAHDAGADAPLAL